MQNLMNMGCIGIEQKANAKNSANPFWNRWKNDFLRNGSRCLCVPLEDDEVVIDVLVEELVKSIDPFWIERTSQFSIYAYKNFHKSFWIQFYFTFNPLFPFNVLQFVWPNTLQNVCILTIILIEFFRNSKSIKIVRFLKSSFTVD